MRIRGTSALEPGRERSGRSPVRSTIGLPLLAVLACVALMAGACSKAETPSSATPDTGANTNTKETVIPQDEGSPKDGGKLVFGVSAEPDGFETASNQFAFQSMLIASSMYESLFTFDEDGNWKPYLAESMEPSDLAAKWTMKVRPNITFHDGTPFDAAAVKANFDAAKKGIPSLGLSVLQDVVVVDPMTVEFRMTQPWASFPGTLAGSTGLMQSPAAISAGTLTSHPVGTGPFVFDNWSHGSSISVKKNPNYWKPGEPHLDAIDFRIITDPTARATSIESGDLDLMITDETSTINQDKNKPELKVLIDAKGDAQNIYMNQGRPPFDNDNARKAVIQATDPNALVGNIGNGLLKPTDQPFAEGTAYHQDDPRYPKYDLAAAKQSVAAYTAETGKPLEFTLTIFSGSTNLQIAQILQQQWAQAGITAQISSQDQATAIKDIIVGKFDATLSPNFGFPEPDYNYVFWHSSFTAPEGTLSINFPHMKNDTVDANLKEGRVNLIPEKRKAAYQAAVRAINEDAAYIWLYRYVSALIADQSVHGLRGAEQTGFWGLAFRPWYGELWVERK